MDIIPFKKIMDKYGLVDDTVGAQHFLYSFRVSSWCELEDAESVTVPFHNFIGEMEGLYGAVKISPDYKSLGHTEFVLALSEENDIKIEFGDIVIQASIVRDGGVTYKDSCSICIKQISCT